MPALLQMGQGLLKHRKDHLLARPNRRIDQNIAQRFSDIRETVGNPRFRFHAVLLRIKNGQLHRARIHIRHQHLTVGTHLFYRDPNHSVAASQIQNPISQHLRAERFQEYLGSQIHSVFAEDAIIRHKLQHKARKPERNLLPVLW